MKEEFDRWYAETFGRYENYMAPLMREHAWNAWATAIFWERQRRKELKAELTETSK